MSNESAAPQSESVAPRSEIAGDVLSGLAAMLVAFPAAIAFGVTIFAPLGGSMAAQGAIAGIVGTIAFGLVAPYARRQQSADFCALRSGGGGAFGPGHRIYPREDWPSRQLCCCSV